MNKLTIIDPADLAKWRRRFYMWAMITELLWFVLGIIVGMKFGPIIMGYGND